MSATGNLAVKGSSANRTGNADKCSKCTRVGTLDSLLLFRTYIGCPVYLRSELRIADGIPGQVWSHCRDIAGSRLTINYPPGTINAHTNARDSDLRTSYMHGFSFLRTMPYLRPVCRIHATSALFSKPRERKSKLLSNKPNLPFLQPDSLEA